MWDGRAHRSLPGAEEARARGAWEATLDSYIEKESPLRGLVRGALGRAPWWVMSFIVHFVALWVACRWPVARLGATEVWRDECPIIVRGFVPDDERTGKIERRIEIQPPEPPPFDPGKVEEFEIGREETPWAGRGPETPFASGGPTLKGPVSLTPHQGDPDVRHGDPTASVERETSPLMTDTKFLFVVDESQPRRGGRDPFTNRPAYVGPWGKGEKTGSTYPPGGPPRVPGYLMGPIKAGLIWLASAQEKDGSWNAKEWDGASPYRVGMTGLALLAFEGMGYTHKKGEFENALNRGLEWLRRNQRPDGGFPWETFYEQGIATMAVCEAYGMTRDPAIGRVAQAAVDYICRLQPEHGGFRYSGPVAKEEGDLSVTGWQIMAIKSGIMAGLNVPTQAVARSRVFLASTARDYGASSYLAGSKEAGSLAVTAIGMACRVFLSDGREHQGEILQAANYLRSKEIKDIATPGGTSGQLTSDLYYVYYSTLAMHQLQGEYWASWRSMCRDPLLDGQQHAKSDAASRYIKGSWDPGRDRWGSRGGRIYTTSLALLSLEVPYRFIALYRGADK